MIRLVPWQMLALSSAAWSLSSANAAEPAEPVASLPTPLRLEHVLSIARTRRGEIRAADAKARASSQRPAIVSALEDPMISPSLDHVPFMLDGANWSVTIEQRFPLSGILGRRGRAAEAEAERIHADADRVRLDVELDAANAFLMLKGRRDTARILEEERSLSSQLVGAANARYAAGGGSQADVLRAEIEVARFDGAIRSIRAEIRGAEAMLNTSLTRPSDASIPELEATWTASSPPSLEAVRDAALARRPELKGGSAEVKRAEAEISVMDSMYAPMAMVRTGPAFTMFDRYGWMVMAGISIPIWRGRLSAAVAEAESMAETAEADLSAMRRMVEGEAAVAREQVIAARERSQALEEEVLPRAKQAIEPTLAGYATGQVPLVSVIEAARALWSAEEELISAELSLGLAWARLNRAMGNGGRKP
jgi:outer membrane protein, heavy metal efflux system